MLSLVIKIFLVLIVIVSELSERDFLVLGSFFFCFSCQTFFILVTLLWLPPEDVQWALTGRGPSPFLNFDEFYGRRARERAGAFPIR